MLEPSFFKQQITNAIMERNSSARSAYFKKCYECPVEPNQNNVLKGKGRVNDSLRKWRTLSSSTGGQFCLGKRMNKIEHEGIGTCARIEMSQDADDAG